MTIYTCRMHPDIRQVEPDDCPKCGMHFVPEDNIGAEYLGSNDQHDDHAHCRGPGTGRVAEDGRYASGALTATMHIADDSGDTGLQGMELVRVPPGAKYERGYLGSRSCLQ
ncbi:heavy metal-binding domain-containing protein [Croceicoccus marinus]|jgi:hypothetical protein|uniref:Heavy metal binding domain-containing protein n=1 Tax=Croceicoccus marinus TaxID=450378 RepID=A0A7G6W134_9SPHN|nr:heavy metal-binding domain-containing protein [Croceicoccus marinus]QNE07699.1 hypothetical protein H4O24_17250 [Croceicoccus marinus]